MNRIEQCFRAIVLACVLVAGWETGWAAPPSQAPEALGRLFNTPQKRAILDQLRRRDALITADQKLDAFTLNGIVRRSGGPSTVWINGVSFHDRHPLASLGVSSARVFVDTGKTVELKVGEHISIIPTSTGMDTP